MSTSQAGPIAGLGEIAQARLLDQRVGHVAELPHALLIARPAQQHTVKAGTWQADQSIDDLFVRVASQKRNPT